MFLLAMIFYAVYSYHTRHFHRRPLGSAPIRRLRFWENVSDYFSARLVKTAELDPRRNYIFAAHPHGVACFSHVCNFLTEATGFSRTFRGLRLFPLLLDTHFYTPGHRDIAHLSGFKGASKESILNLLTEQPSSGASVLLIPGGASEALLSKPGHYNLIVKKRKGFVRMALTTGASLVPVLAFGETSLFDLVQPTPGGLMDRVQKLVYRLTGFAIPIVSGAGLFGGEFLKVLPRKLPVTTVVGAPLHVDKWEGSTRSPAFDEAVDALHAKYCAALRALWEAHAAAYAPRAPEGAAGRAAVTDGKVCFRRKSMEFVE